MSFFVALAATSPTAPTISGVAVSQSSLKFTLLTPSVEPQTGIGSYNLLQSVVGVTGPFSLIANILPSQFPYTWTGANSSTNYWLAAQGVDNSSQHATSPNSNIVQVATPASTGTQKKWNPGQYMGSSAFTKLGNAALAQKSAEIDIVRAGPAQVLGWEGFYFLRTLMNGGQGVLDASTIDTDYRRITGYQSGATVNAVYNAPKRMGIYILASDFFSNQPTASCLPDYICNSAIYGPVGPDGVHKGYWTIPGAGSPSLTSGCALAVWRPNCRIELGNILTLLASHVLPDGYTMDASPYIEFILPYIETAVTAPTGTTDSSYSVSGKFAQLLAFNATMQAVWPTTLVGCTNNYCDGPDETQSLTNSLAANQLAASGPDVFGYSSGQNAGNGLSQLTWGQCAYVGLKSPGDGNPNAAWGAGGTDQRGIIPFIGNIQNTELVFNVTYQPADLFKQADTTLRCTHLTWQFVSGNATTSANWFGSAPGQTQWNPASSGGVLAQIVAQALANTTYPSALP